MDWIWSYICRSTLALQAQIKGTEIGRMLTTKVSNSNAPKGNESRRGEEEEAGQTERRRARTRLWVAELRAIRKIKRFALRKWPQVKMWFPSFYGFHNEVLSARKGHKAGKVRWRRMRNGEGGSSIDRAFQTRRPGTDRAQKEPQQSDKGVIIPWTWIIPW